MTANASSTPKFKVGDKTQFAIEARPGAEFQKGDIIIVTEVSHPFYWGKRKRDGSKGMFYAYELTKETKA